MKKITENTIDQDTPIIPEMIAETVANDYVRLFFKKEISEWNNLNEKQKEELNKKTDDAEKSLTEYLVDKANFHYQYSEKFNKDILAKGNKGRDTLYMFMYHWVGISEGKLVNSNARNYQKLIDNHNKNKEEFFRSLSTNSK